MIGSASDSLDGLAGQARTPLFDVVLIDANKDGYPEYFRKAVPLLKQGGLLLADNTLMHMERPEEGDCIREYNEAVVKLFQLHSIIVPVLTGHGIDGLTVSIKKAFA